MIKYGLTFLLLYFVLLGFAQEPFSVPINQSTGLPSNSVYDIYQDKKGFIWITTEVGLVRYDGLQYKTYSNEKQTSKAGSCIREDDYGRIWYKNFDGYIYYLENEELKILYNSPLPSYTPYGLIKNKLYIIENKQVVIYNLKDLKKDTTLKTKVIVPEDVTDNGKDFFFTSDGIIFKINSYNKLTSTKFSEKISGKFRQIIADDNYIYVTNKYNEDKVVYFYNTDLKFVKKTLINDPKLIRGGSIKSNELWIYTSDGVSIYSTNGILLNSYFREKNISSVLKDRQDNYWFCTTNEGIFFVPSLQTKLFPFLKNTPNKINKTLNGFLIGSNKGEIYSYNSTLTKNKLFYSNSDLAEVYFTYLDPKNNNYFFSSKGSYIIPNLDFKKSVPLEYPIKSITKIDEKHYAFSASGLTALLKIQSKIKENFSVWDTYYAQHKSKNYDLISVIKTNSRDKAISYNSIDQTILFSGNLGTFKTNPLRTKQIKKDGKDFFASNLFSHSVNFYALTSNGNFYRINPKEKFTLLNPLLKISEGSVKMIKQFEDDFFILTNNRLLNFNARSNSVKNININIKTLQIYDLEKDNNYLIVLTEKGIIKLPLFEQQIKKELASLELNYIKVNGEKINFSNAPELSYDQNELVINFSLLNFSDNYQSQLYYQLNNESWQIVPSETSDIRFPSLSTGKYQITFMINDTVSDKKITFTIHPPFWRSWWFILLTVLMIFILGLLYYRYQLNQLNKQIILLKDKMKLEQSLAKSILTSVKSQMNPHFFYNALNTIQAYIFTNDKKNASYYLSKFSKLTRTILEMSEQENVSLEKEIEALNLYLDLEKMRFEGDFQFTFNIENCIDKELIKIPSMLIQPYLENSVKHGLLHKTGQKLLTVSFELKMGKLKVMIDDNGIGRKKAEEINRHKEKNHQSFSTEANQKRLNILNQYSDKKVAIEILDKMDKNHQPDGTTVILYIPIN